MKRSFLLLLSACVLLCSCGKTVEDSKSTDNEQEIAEETDNSNEEATIVANYHFGDVTEDYVLETDPEDFYSLNDQKLLDYMEDELYEDLLLELDENEYFIENVESVYVSKEYIDELTYNSKENIFFGYTLSELDSVFEGKRYIFTLGENGKTEVQEFSEYDDRYEKALKNVAIGTGVILVCITVSSLTVTAAPAVSMILAVSAKTGAVAALSSGSLAAISSGIITGITTGDMDEALKTAAYEGSNAFKWGAISGAIAGGLAEGIGLYGATANQLTMNEAAIIQRETKWPLDVIKNLHSLDEYNVYKNAGLVPVKIDGNWAFLQNVDWDFKDENGFTNLQRVLERGNAPIGPDGKSFELHHIGQRADSPLAILTHTQHHASGDYGIIHYADEGKDIGQAAWAAQKSEFWEKMAKMYMKVKGLS